MADATCSVNDRTHSPRARLTRGMCDKHYMRWWKWGDPLARKTVFASAEDRFWHYVDKRGPDECWPYGGTITNHGYGQIRDGKKAGPAHVFSYLLAGNAIPDGFTLDHTCHDPAVCTLCDECPHRRCCNPAHLEPVTRGVNSLRGGGPSAVNARKDACSRAGHPYDEANTAWRLRTRKNGTTYWARYCRTCAREAASTPATKARAAERYQKRKQAATKAAA